MSQATAEKPDLQTLEHIASQIRRDVVRMVHSMQSGHPGGSLGCTDFFTALFFSELRHTPQPFSMDGKGEDLFFLSNGHISPVYYSALARSGYFPIAELGTFRKLDSRLQGHPTTHEGLPGVRIASGSLGQGLSVAIGAALSKKLNGDEHLIYSLHGDGELQEGQIWEALMFAAHNKVDNLIATIDRNNAQIDGPTADVLSLGDLRAKLESFGWQVLETQGNDIAAVLRTLGDARALTGRGTPIAIIMHTLMGYGVDFMQGDYRWHGIAPSDTQLATALAQLPMTVGDY